MQDVQGPFAGVETGAAVTPEQRMHLMNLVASWDDVTNPRRGMQVMEEIIMFVEQLEYSAAHANTYDASWRDGPQ